MASLIRLSVLFVLAVAVFCGSTFKPSTKQPRGLTFPPPRPAGPVKAIKSTFLYDLVDGLRKLLLRYIQERDSSDLKSIASYFNRTERGHLVNTTVACLYSDSVGVTIFKFFKKSAVADTNTFAGQPLLRVLLNMNLTDIKLSDRGDDWKLIEHIKHNESTEGPFTGIQHTTATVETTWTVFSGIHYQVCNSTFDFDRNFDMDQEFDSHMTYFFLHCRKCKLY